MALVWRLGACALFTELHARLVFSEVHRRGFLRSSSSRVLRSMLTVAMMSSPDVVRAESSWYFRSKEKREHGQGRRSI